MRRKSYWQWLQRERISRRRLLGAAGAGAAGLALAVGCGGDKSGETPAADGTSTATAPVGTGSGPSEKRPNILVIMTDQHRAAAMGCEGNPVVQTPNLDRLAGEGALLRHAYCQGPLCMPARVSFLTERYVRDHGAFENKWEAPTELPTFLQSLQAAGYHTGCIGKMHFYRHAGAGDTHDRVDYITSLGFDEPIETVGKRAAANVRTEYSDYLESLGLYDTYREWMAYRRYGRGQVEVNGELVDRLPMWHTESVALPADAYIDNWTGRRAVEWIESYDSEQPFFQWVGFPGPHDPWDAPDKYVERYRGSDVPLGTLTPPELPDSGPLRIFIEAFQAYGHSDTLTKEIVEEVRRYYYANVTLIDERIGDIIAALERKGILDNTWIFYTSDHGEMLGDHLMLTKMMFYEPSVRVPLIIRPPGGMQSKVVDDLVEHIDVPATIREIAGGPALQGSEGISLLGHVAGPASEEVRHLVRSENYGFAMFRTDRYKLVVYEDTKAPVQLFDLQEDPDEDHNVVGEPPYAGVVEEMMAEHALPFLSIEPKRLGPGLIEEALQESEGPPVP
jgi:choline-sulfatase